MVTIRPAEPKDADAAVDVLRRSITELCSADHQDDAATLAEWLANKTTQNFLAWLANTNHSCVVADEGGRLLGLGMLGRGGRIHLLQPIMLKRHTLVHALLLLGLTPALTMAQSTQPVTFESLDKGITLSAYWTTPQSHEVQKKFPVVVALHGCGGLPANRELVSYPKGRYVKMLADQGYGVLYVDSFSGRNTKEICSQTMATRRITEFTRRFDVYAALDWLATQPTVDAQRLAVLGWSHGGQTVLAAADRTEALVKNAKVQPKALVAFYPGCRRFGEMFRYESVAPLYILSGSLDNWTPPAPCRDLADKLRRTQPDQIVKFIEYPDSHHGFDSPLPVRERQNVGGTRSGTATTGGNAEAREHSSKELLEFLRNHL